MSKRTLLCGLVLLVAIGLACWKIYPWLTHEDIGPIHAVAFSSDGKSFVTGNEDGTVRLWDAATGQQLRSFGKQGPVVVAVAVALDGRHIAATWNDIAEASHGVVMWDVATGLEVRRFLGHTAWANSVAFTPDSRHIVSGGDDKTLRVWELDTGREVRCLHHTRVVNCVAVSPDGQHILSGEGGYDDPTLRLWNMKDGSLVRVFAGHEGAIHDAVFSSDGKQIASASHDEIRVWSVASGETVVRCVGTGFQAVAFDPTNRYLVSASWIPEGTVVIWDATDGKRLAALSINTLGHDVAVSPDGKIILSAHGEYDGHCGWPLSWTTVKDGVAIAWDFATHKELLRVGNEEISDE